MTLGDYMNYLVDLIDKDPEYLKLQVVHSSDSEGNSFQPVYFTPRAGNFTFNEFIGTDEFKDFKKKKSDINAVCIN